ncbi:hypothetical protein KY385_00265 [Candidatus Parcubacteria bacterium]|nr:hypothetical protein [Candidatus Parcubacteria bacterium]
MSPEGYSKREGAGWLRALGEESLIGGEINGKPAERFLDECPDKHRDRAINLLTGLAKMQREGHPQFESYREVLRERFDRYVNNPQEPGG